MKRQLLVQDKGCRSLASSVLYPHSFFTWEPQHRRLLASNLSITPTRTTLSAGTRFGGTLYTFGSHSRPKRTYSNWARPRNWHPIASYRASDSKENSNKGTVEKDATKKQALNDVHQIVVKEEKMALGKLKNLQKWVMDGLIHYWEGSKQLWKNIKSSAPLVRKLTNGQSLTRRERAELLNTATDLFRLLPFAFFVIVPFMEFLLPFALKLFPNMLPSTFQDKLKKEEDMKKQLKLKLSMASFLQDALKQMSMNRTDNNTKDFLEFMKRVQQGQPVTAEELHTYANIFSENFTLLDASQQRPLLISMCKFLGLNAYGTNSFLRWQIRMKLGRIREDDKLILKEGIKILSFEELQQACADRGMLSAGLSKPALRELMEDWLRLSLSTDDEKMSVFLLSRALIKDLAPKPQETVVPAPLKEEDKTLLEVADAVSVLSSEDALHQEREELEKLKLDQRKLEAQLDMKEDIVPPKEAKMNKRLEAKLDKVLEGLERNLHKAEKEVGDKLNIIDKDRDGVITTEEIAAAVELLRDKPTEEEIVDVLRKLDLDQDGRIALKDVEKVMTEVLLRQKQAEQKAERAATS